MHRCQTANHAELILPQLDTVTYLLMPHAARRAALKDWSLGGKPHLFGAATACMGCGPNGQSCKTMILSRRDCAYRLANTERIDAAAPSGLSNWDACGGCPPGFGGFKGLEFPSATGKGNRSSSYLQNLRVPTQLLRAGRLQG